MARTVAGCDAILHQAALKSVPRSLEEPRSFVEVNVIGTLNVLLAARDQRIPVVSASSSSVYGDQDPGPLAESLEPRPRSPYAATKLAAEALCRAWSASYGVPTVSLRYFNVYGPGQDPTSTYASVVPRFITACLQDVAPTVYGDGEQSRDFTFVEDVVEANLLAARSPGAVGGRVLNVGGGGEPTSVNTLLATIGRLTGTHPKPVHEAEREGEIRRSQADLTLARELLAFEPEVNVEDGLRRTVEWFRDARFPPRS
jgi:nucleoside-diphosphate-sugar epimerase